MFCQHCGKENNDTATFCSGCGTSLAAPVATPAAAPAAAPAPAATAVKRHLHCPKCKSTNISITTESSVTGAVTTHHGSFSSSHMSNNHRNFWMCADCGAKFRNIQNLEEEIKKSKVTPIVYAVMTVISIILSIFLYNKIQEDAFGFLLYAFLPAAVAAAIIFGCLTLSGFLTLNKMRKELAYLQVHCFN